MPTNRRPNYNNRPNNAKSVNAKKIKKSRDKRDKSVNKNGKKKSKALKIIKWIFIIGILLILIAAGVLAGIISGIIKKEVISIDKLRISTENTKVVDAEGNLIATLNADEKREIIKIDEMSKYIPTAFVAIEDERFYEHQGVDIKRTAAATFKYITSRGKSDFGGSTITQQLVKNITKEDERDAMRKIKEMARAYNLEKTLTKDEILELYLNMIFMGEDVYGVQMAAKLYFNKSASELDLAESAFIAGINNSPNAYKPFSDDPDMKQKIKDRTLTVINKMHDLKRIDSEEEYRAAVEKVNNGLPFSKGNVSANNYSYHTDAVINQVIEDLQKANPDMTKQAAEFYLYNSGLTIYSTQVTYYQEMVEQEYSDPDYLYKSSKVFKKDENGEDTDEPVTTQSAMVIIDHTTGHVVAAVGGLGDKTSRGLNRATQGRKQPGSSIKPIGVIAPSLEEGLITAATVVDDSPLTIGSWNPKNASRSYSGLIPVREILVNSINVPEVKMLKNLTPEKSIEYLKQFGITTLTEDDANLALALGGVTIGISPLEMAAAYACINNEGVYIEPKFYTKVVDAEGNVVLEAQPETRRVISAENAYVIKNILVGAVSGGTASGAWISGIEVAAKTGTTDNAEERWLCGMTPYFTAATWFGFDHTETVPNWGANTAMTIWGNVMRRVHDGLPSASFTRPANIVTARVCTKSGLLPTDLCEEAGCVRSEIFVRGTVPTKQCETHVKARVCEGNEHYELATEFCPHTVERVFITRPESDKNTSWKEAADAGDMLPTKTCEIHTKPITTPSPKPTTAPSATPKVTPSATPAIVTTPTPVAINTAAPTGTPAAVQ